MTTKASNSVLNLTDPVIDAANINLLSVQSAAAHSVLIGQGTSPVMGVAPGTSGLPLVSNGAGVNPSFRTIDASAITGLPGSSIDLAGGNITGILPVVHGGTGRSFLSNHRVLLGSDSNAINTNASSGFAGNPFVCTGPTSDPDFGINIVVDRTTTRVLILNGVEFRVLTTTAFYWVSLTGSDTTGDGSIGNPWASIDHAYYAASANTIFGDQRIDLLMFPGTYSLGHQAFTATAGNWSIYSTTFNPADVVIQTSGYQINGIAVTGSANVIVSWITIAASGGYALTASAGGVLVLNNVNLDYCGTVAGAVGTHIAAYDNGTIIILGNYVINGAADGFHFLCDHSTIVASQSAGPITVSSSIPVFFTAFAICANGGFIRAVSGSYAGVNATGVRVRLETNGTIETGGQIIGSYFPGNSDEVPTTGGQWS